MLKQCLLWVFMRVHKAKPTLLPFSPHLACKGNINVDVKVSAQDALLNKGNNKITELQTILQRESQNS